MRVENHVTRSQVPEANTRNFLGRGSWRYNGPVVSVEA